MQQPIKEKLYALKLQGMAEALEHQEQDEGTRELSFLDRLALLVDQQWNWRQNQALTRRVLAARLRGTACVENIDYRAERGLNRSVIRGLAQESTWVANHEHIFVLGPTGVGKSYVAPALAQKACRDGYRVYYTRATTQFGRMCERLEIRIIAANSPQAKGRVERNNGVHQDRLVKKLRRKGIQDYEAANAYLEAEYLPEHNRRFAREAARPEDYHVRRPSAARLREVFRLETERWISNDWVVQYRGHFLQLKPQNRRYGPTQSKASIREWEDGAVEVRYRKERIEYEDLVLRPRVVTAPKARPHREAAPHGRSKPAPNHPWREGHEERRKQLLLGQRSALIGTSASASP